MTATAETFTKDHSAQQHFDFHASKRHLKYERQASHVVYTVQIYMIVDYALYTQ